MCYLLFSRHLCLRVLAVFVGEYKITGYRDVERHEVAFVAFVKSDNCDGQGLGICNFYR